MVDITIDGQKLSVEKGTTILDAAKKLHINIPTLCFLKVDGIDYINTNVSCMVCVVELVDSGRIVPSCAARVKDGMVINTQSEKVLSTRRKVVNNLIANHPSSCLTCNESSYCELQKIANDLKVDNTEVVFKREADAFEITADNPALFRDPNKCIQCNRCKTMCNKVQGVGAIKEIGLGYIGDKEHTPLDETECVYCGQCITVCPTGALMEVNRVHQVWEALKDSSKYVVVQTAPAVRTALGESFNMGTGHNVEGKMVTALKRLGFDKIFDTSFAADLTTLEETKEFLNKLELGEKLPILTSCCPAWVRFLEKEYPEFLPLVSSCKSPQEMMGALIKSYFAEKEGLNPKDIVTVAIMPCVAKKYEASRKELGSSYGSDVDFVLTSRELAQLIKTASLDFSNLPDSQYDNILSESSTDGCSFGASSGVIESVVRTAHHWITGEKMSKLEFDELRGTEGIKEATVDINGKQLHIAAVNGLANARQILENIKSGVIEYHAIEVMACPGGCIGGGGQPYHGGDLKHLLDERKSALKKANKSNPLNLAQENPMINKLYDDFLGEIGGEKAHKLLHTSFKPRPVKKNNDRENPDIDPTN